MEETNYVYILRSGNSNIFKIGVSKNIEKRIKQLQTGCPFRISTYCFFEAPSRELAFHCEFNLHKFFANYKSELMCGEWYCIEETELRTLKKYENTMQVMRHLLDIEWQWKQSKKKQEKKSAFLENW